MYLVMAMEKSCEFSISLLATKNICQILEKRIVE